MDLPNVFIQPCWDLEYNCKTVLVYEKNYKQYYVQGRDGGLYKIVDKDGKPDKCAVAVMLIKYDQYVRHKNKTKLS